MALADVRDLVRQNARYRFSIGRDVHQAGQDNDPPARQGGGIGLARLDEFDGEAVIPRLRVDPVDDLIDRRAGCGIVAARQAVGQVERPSDPSLDRQWHLAGHHLRGEEHRPDRRHDQARGNQAQGQRLAIDRWREHRKIGRQVPGQVGIERLVDHHPPARAVAATIFALPRRSAQSHQAGERHSLHRAVVGRQCQLVAIDVGDREPLDRDVPVKLACLRTHLKRPRCRRRRQNPRHRATRAGASAGAKPDRDLRGFRAATPGTAICDSCRTGLRSRACQRSAGRS